MEFTVVMDAHAFSKEVLENILPILAFVSTIHTVWTVKLEAVFGGLSVAS